MRFGIWSTPSQSESDIKLQAKHFPTNLAETKNENNPVAHRKDRSRYDIPAQRNVSNMKSSEKLRLTVEKVANEYPIIDRVPTAIGYQSDGSDEEWLEEKSRCSRYVGPENGFTDDDVDVFDDEEEENRDDDEEIDEDGSDKYSQKMAKTKPKKTKSHRDTISALWSHSTDSETDKDNWHVNSASYEHSNKDYGENVSYVEEKGIDPIYDTNQNKQTKHKLAKSPISPNGISDTSSISDNLQKMLHFAPSNDKAGTDMESNIHILKGTAAEEYGSPIKETKKSARKTRRVTKVTKLLKPISKSKDEVELSRSTKQGKSKDAIELSRSITIPEKLAPENSLSISVIPENSRALYTDDSADVQSTKSGRQSRAMYTKSLLTEDSDNEIIQMHSIIPEPEQSLASTVVPQERDKDEASIQSKKNRIGILLSNSWSKRTTEGRKRKEKDETKPSTGFFAKMRKQRKTNDDQNKDEAENCNNIINVAELPTDLTSPRSKTSTEPKELDEYSRSTKEANDNEPDVVQCLRYFQCGSVANHVNVAITVADCGTATGNDHDEEEDDADNILDINPTTPKPRVEVYLSDEQKSKTPRPRSVQSCGNSMSCKNDSPEEDDLTEIPGLGLSNTPSIIIDVTGMQLHLDGDSEIDRKLSTVRGTGGSHHTRSDISVTSITVPVVTTTQSESNEVFTGKEQEETELKLEDYVTKINKKRGIRGFFNKFKKTS